MKKFLQYALTTMIVLPIFVVSVRSQQGLSKIAPCYKPQSPTDLSQYVGKYRMSDGSVFVVEEKQGRIAMAPRLWRSVYSLSRVKEDVFGIEERPDRSIEFVRDTTGCVAAVKIVGFSSGDDAIFPRIGKETTPIELLLEGKPKTAAGQLLKGNSKEVDGFIDLARMFIQSFPSRTSDGVIFLQHLLAANPKNSSIHALLGDAYIAARNRKAGLESYRRAFEVDPANKNALRGLRRLNALPKSAPPEQGGWTIPFSLEAVFKKPNRSEIKAVEEVWAKRDLSPKDVVEVATGKLDLGGTLATVRIISHSVHGQKHYGAIVVPEGLNSKSPVIMDLKGVSWNFSPLQLNRVRSAGVLGDQQAKFIYVIPSFRGETLQFNGVDYVSEGDRTDSWDGATDDALALVNVAVGITPQADEDRICAFGRSRGGSVALLAGIRNSKIKCVLDWTGPTDWFELMGLEGWTQQEIVADGLLLKAAPDEDGGQVIERVLSKAIQGKQNLRDVRFQMIASSPLYFANRLPRLQVHYGIEDEIVPIVNGRVLAQKMFGRSRMKFESFFHPNVGHELDSRIAYAESKRFLLSLLAVGGTRTN